MNKGPEWKDEMDLVYYDCVYHCIRNGEDFLEDARLLADEGRYGHSVSMSVLGREELMKSWFFFISMIHRQPITWSHRGFRQHRMKQMMVPILMHSNDVIDDFENIPEYVLQEMAQAFEESEELQEFLLIDDDDWTLETIGEFLRIVIRVLDQSGFFEYMKNEMFTKEKMIERGKKLENQLKSILDESAMENLKQRGFYVDINLDDYHTPFMISREQAEEEIEQFEQILELTFDATGDYTNLDMPAEDKARTIEFLRYLFDEFGAFGGQTNSRSSLPSS